MCVLCVCCARVRACVCVRNARLNEARRALCVCARARAVYVCFYLCARSVARREFSVLAMSLVAPAIKFANTLHLQEWADAGGEPGQAGKALIYLARWASLGMTDACRVRAGRLNLTTSHHSRVHLVVRISHLNNYE